jgi:hypothetical protein
MELRMTVEATLDQESVRGGFRFFRHRLVWLVLALALSLLAITQSVNRDEGQYVGPAAVAADLRPFNDYLHMQTPLQAWIVGPVAHQFHPHAFIALRLFTASMGLITLALVYLSQKRIGATTKASLAATIMLASCYSFQFAFSVVRNDALPALLETSAIYISMAALKAGTSRILMWSVVGLLMGAAASTKLLYLCSAGGVGGCLLIGMMTRRVPWFCVLAYSVGLVGGLLPCALAWREAPDAFVYGVITFQQYSAAAWYKIINKAWILTPGLNVLSTIGILLVGPGAGALWLFLSDLTGRGVTALGVDISGLAAALFPVPSNFQYATPMLIPLFIRLGKVEINWISAPSDLVNMLQRRRRVPKPMTEIYPLWDPETSPDECDPQPAHSRFAMLLLSLGTIAGVGYGMVIVLTPILMRGELPPLRLERDAQFISNTLNSLQITGPIATLSPQIVLDSGHALDPRFAMGVQAYRGAYLSSPTDLARFKFIGPTNIQQSLAEIPPGALVVGLNAHLDDGLRQFANDRDYVRIFVPHSKYELFVAQRPKN